MKLLICLDAFDDWIFERYISNAPDVICFFFFFQRPLKAIAVKSGDVYIPRGVAVPALDKDYLWGFEPKQLCKYTHLSLIVFLRVGRIIPLHLNRLSFRFLHEIIGKLQENTTDA